MTIHTARSAYGCGRREIILLFAQALTQTVTPDMLARGRRVALNFADVAARGAGRTWRYPITRDRRQRSSPANALARFKGAGRLQPALYHVCARLDRCSLGTAFVSINPDQSPKGMLRPMGLQLEMSRDFLTACQRPGTWDRLP